MTLQETAHGNERQSDAAVRGAGLCKGGFGPYTSASEVVRAALRPMDEQDLLRAGKLEQIRAGNHQRLNSGPSKNWGVEEVMREGRARRARKAA